MNLPIFFEEDISLQNGFLTLQEETGHHIHQVLRLKTGDQISITNGKGIILEGVLTSMLGKKVVFKAINEMIIPKPIKTISIGMGIIKNTSRFEWFIEKAVEIGVSQIIPVISKRTEKTGIRKKRMQQIMITALLQSKQAWLPELIEPTSFSTLVSQNFAGQKIIAFCEEQVRQPLHQLNIENNVQMLIGPEGDFTKEEITLALEKEYIPVTLGKNRLRTETAGIVSLVLLNN